MKTIVHAGRPGIFGLFLSRGQGIFFLFLLPALGSTWQPTQGVHVALFPVVRGPWRETDHLLLSSADIKNAFPS